MNESEPTDDEIAAALRTAEQPRSEGPTTFWRESFADMSRTRRHLAFAYRAEVKRREEAEKRAEEWGRESVLQKARAEAAERDRDSKQRMIETQQEDEIALTYRAETAEKKLIEGGKMVITGDAVEVAGLEEESMSDINDVPRSSIVCRPRIKISAPIA